MIVDSGMMKMDVSDGRDAVELFFIDNAWSDFDLSNSNDTIPIPQ
jgi:hypothetical protein